MPCFRQGLTANHSGEWRYRVGDYRIICFIEQEILTIEVIAIDRRSRIYRSK
ncbi:type II toxin-antitoxin system RelE family toxin [Olsenella kribbiana]|uniref:type II toxin-antitoxin system RelE family toxin n=1 Tax=Olsenella kribbiana TaxID=3115221 RepID=UPI003D2FCB34